MSESNSNQSDQGGTKSSDFDPSLPDNAAELQAANDAAAEGNPEGDPRR
jgi:hypothetical protein